MGQGSSEQPDLESLRRKTSFSDSEIQAWYDAFKKACPSGRLDEQQFIAVYEDQFPGGDVDATRLYSKQVFRTFDVDQNGTLDFREFLCGLSVTASSGTTEQKLHWAFSMFDIDGDGFITREEMLRIVRVSMRIMMRARHHYPELEQLDGRVAYKWKSLVFICTLQN